MLAAIVPPNRCDELRRRIADEKRSLAAIKGHEVVKNAAAERWADPLRRPIIFVAGVSPNFDNRFWPRAQQRFLATRHFAATQTPLTV
ncbi:hypothetical protein [Pseudobythopirellula maris]|uniref:hypothetical protein n=1 Tax=Pseudobythopirellula maris TaxID=2527991 RepID=UPI0011B70445|nr:hypothetical protein [Pseudobythopirellula maris]